MFLRVLSVASFVCLVASTAFGQAVLPDEGAELQRTHVRFQWPPVAGAASYELVIVEDDGSPDPFDGAEPLLDLEVSSPMPQTIITSGLGFGMDCAWRVRGMDTRPMPWGDTYRFSILEFPSASFPAMEITLGEGEMEPGLTLFSVGGNAYAVTADGDPVWFLTPPEGVNGIGDIRLLPNGRILFSSFGALGGRAFETTLDGEVTWMSPEDPELSLHHEVFPMPNGNVLSMAFVFQDVEVDGEMQSWMGDRIVEFERATNEVVWEWNSFDHFSLEDFDPTIMENPAGNGSYDWTHSNAVVYNQADNSVYISVRHLSRVTRIDYATGNIVYNMGFEMPSGETDFGDNLFSFQHAPELLPNGNMMLFDNGNRRDHEDQTAETGITKAIELAFTGDPTPTAASIAWEFELPGYNAFVGDTDRLPGGNTLVTAGVDRVIYEVAPDTSVVWSLAMFNTGIVARAERIASLISPLPPDFDGDGDVDGGDLGLLLGSWGDCEPGVYCPPDLNNDGTVDGSDLGILLASWG